MKEKPTLTIMLFAILLAIGFISFLPNGSDIQNNLWTAVFSIVSYIWDVILLFGLALIMVVAGWVFDRWLNTREIHGGYTFTKWELGAISISVSLLAAVLQMILIYMIIPRSNLPYRFPGLLYESITTTAQMFWGFWGALAFLMGFWLRKQFILSN